jgi:hypothetical protein
MTSGLPIDQENLPESWISFHASQETRPGKGRYSIDKIKEEYYSLKRYFE